MKEICTTEDAKAFIKGDYTEECIQYLKENTNYRQKDLLYEEDYQHIVSCLQSMVAGIFKFYDPGGFGKAFLSNSLNDVLDIADEVNLISLNLYRIFLYNKVSRSYQR